MHRGPFCSEWSASTFRSERREEQRPLPAKKKRSTKAVGSKKKAKKASAKRKSDRGRPSKKKSRRERPAASSTDSTPEQTGGIRKSDAPIFESHAFREVFTALWEPPPMPRDHREAPIPGSSVTPGMRKIGDLVAFLRTKTPEAAERHRRPPSIPTKEDFENLGRNAVEVRREAMKLLPRSKFATEFDALDRVAMAALHEADGMIPEAVLRKKRKPSGRKVQEETRILDHLDGLLKPIPSMKRRELMARLMRDVLKMEVGDGEAVRKRLYDFRKKPGRSPKT